MTEPSSTKKISKLSLLVIVMITSFLTTFTGSALNLSVPAISGEFHAGAVSVGWIITGYILSSAALSVPFGHFADLYGKKPVLVTGQILFTVFALLCSLAWNIQTIIAFRLLQGVGAAMIFSTNVAILVASFPPQMRGKMLGFSVSATYLGLSLGPVLGGVLNHNFGWRSVFYVTTALAAAIAALSVFKLQEPRSLPAGEEDVQTGTGGRSDKKSEVNTPDDRETKKSSGSRKKTVAKQMDLPKEEVVLALESIVDPVSLYEPVYADGGDTIYVMDQVGDHNDDKNWLDEIALKEAIRGLSDREKRILNLRFFKGMTQIEVSAEIGISQAQVSRLEKGALARIKKQL